MDPKQCYLEILEAMKQGDLATARERAQDLKQWLDRGGFCPPDYTADEVRSYLATVLHRTKPAAKPQQPVPTTEMAKVVDYLYEDEKAHYESCAPDERSEHVFTALKRLREWLDDAEAQRDD